MERQLAQSIVHTFLVENRRFKGDNKFLSLVKDPVKLESVDPSRFSGLCIRKMGDLGGVQAELECLRKPIRSVPIVVETDKFSISFKVILSFSLVLSMSFPGILFQMKTCQKVVWKLCRHRLRFRRYATTSKAWIYGMDMGSPKSALNTVLSV